MLRTYRRRGVHLVEVVPQVRALEVLGMRSDRIRIRVEERVARARVRSATGKQRSLGGTGYAPRTLTFQRVSTGWTLSSVLTR